MDIENICKLMEQFDRSSAVEVEIESDGVSLHFRKPEIPMNLAMPNTIVPTIAVQNMPNAMAPNALTPITPSTESAPPTDTKSITAPLAGTFYRAPSPDADPFVTEGQQIHEGDVIGIIEAMKMMNEVTATADGVVTEILPQDGELVAYDQVLLRMK